MANAPYTIIPALGAGLELRLDNALTCHYRMIRPRSSSNSLGLLTLWQQACLEGRLSLKAPRQSDSVGSAGVYLRVAESLSTCRVGERFDPWLNLRRLAHPKNGLFRPGGRRWERVDAPRSVGRRFFACSGREWVKTVLRRNWTSIVFTPIWYYSGTCSASASFRIAQRMALSLVRPVRRASASRRPYS